jgi:CDGSH-type Zn-finger protein/ferredoxin
MARVTIECKPNGPYLVKDLQLLKGAAGESIPVKAAIALCRCGGSGNKPFCDGTHRGNGFSAPASGGTPGERETYRGERITIHDNRTICAHAGLCTDRLATVFKYGSEPWIDPGGAAVEAIIETVRSCPSGALSYSLGDADPPQDSRPPSISVTRNGPYAITGSVELPGQQWGEGASAEHYTLCRCGASKNKPFCDGSHWEAKFQDPAV